MQEIISLTNAPSDLDVNQTLTRERNLRRYGRLTQELDAASIGIESQNVTYETDKRFCALVDVLVANVRDQLEDMQMAMRLAKRGGQSGQVSSPATGAPAALVAVASSPGFDVPPPFQAPPKPEGRGGDGVGERMDDTDQDDDDDQLEIF